MFSRAIIATDLSPASFAVVNCVGGLKTYGMTECLLLLCLNLQEAALIGFSYSTYSLKSTLEQQKEILEKHGLSVEARIATGFAKQEINRTADEEDHSLIVVGSKGHSMVGEKLLGGIASSVIYHARKPVLLVPIEMQQGEGNVCIQATRCDFSEHVLFPTDFSEDADRAFSYVEKLAADGARRITLLHVQDNTQIEPDLEPRMEEFNKIDRTRLEAMADVLRSKGDAEIGIELPYGSPIAEILRMILERDVQMVVMGRQGRGFIKEVLLGSVSHSVARHSVAPVLLIPGSR